MLLWEIILTADIFRNIFSGADDNSQIEGVNGAASEKTLQWHFVSTSTAITSELITNRKSHTGFRLVPISMTLNDLERHNSTYFAFFSWNSTDF